MASAFFNHDAVMFPLVTIEQIPIPGKCGQQKFYFQTGTIPTAFTVGLPECSRKD